MEEVCLYNKYGVCKFREGCRRQHCEETCREEKCEDKNLCQKRHPKICRKFLSEKGCRFGTECSYKHLSSCPSPKQKDDLTVTIELLTSVVEQMSKKIIQLETEVGELKKTPSNPVNLLVELEYVSSNKNIQKENTIEEKNEIKGLKESSEIKEVPNDQTTSSPKKVKSHGEPAIERNNEKKKHSDNIFHSKECVYQCKKEVDETIAIVRREKITNTEDPEINDCELRMENLGVLIIKKNVPNKDTFDIHKKDSQKMSQFCTMVTQYD